MPDRPRGSSRTGRTSHSLLIARGFDVDCNATALHISDSEYRIDLFHTYFDEQGVLRFPFGIAGTSTLTK